MDSKTKKLHKQEQNSIEFDDEDDCTDCDMYKDITHGKEKNVVEMVPMKQQYLNNNGKFESLCDRLENKMRRFSNRIKTKVNNDKKHEKDSRTYTIYRSPFSGNISGYFRSKTKGMIVGAVDGTITGCSNGAKWCGAGGWIVGGVATLVGFICGGVSGFFCGGLYGLVTNEDEVTSYWRHYRETFSIGDNSGQHGTWS